MSDTLETSVLTEPVVAEVPQAQAETPTPTPEVIQEAPTPAPPPEPIAPRDPWEGITDDMVADRYKTNKQALYQKFGLHDNVINALDFLEKGGSFDEYLRVKTADWTKVPAENLMRDKLREQYAQYGLSSDKVEKLVNAELRDKYKVGEDFDSESEEVQIPRLRMEAEAEAYRRELLQRQAQFTVPERQVSQEVEIPYEQQVAQNRTTWEREVPVQQFLQQKTLKMDDYTFEVQNPDDVVRAMADPKFYLQFIAQKDASGRVVMENGQPKTDPQAVVNMAVWAMHRDQIIKGLINHGKTLGKKELQENAEAVRDVRTQGAQTQPADLLSALEQTLMQRR